jgi:hypothetical protein
VLHYEALQQLTRDRVQQRQAEAQAEQLALQARGQRQRRRRRLALAARLDVLLRARPHAARDLAGG